MKKITISEASFSIDELKNNLIQARSLFNKEEEICVCGKVYFLPLIMEENVKKIQKEIKEKDDYKMQLVYNKILDNVESQTMFIAFKKGVICLISEDVFQFKELYHDLSF